jgi:two-component system sensor histidine kinase YesM
VNLIKWISGHDKMLVKLFRKIKIQPRLLLLFLIISLIPLFITSIFSYRSSTHDINVKISTYSLQVMNQMSENIRRVVERFEYDSEDIGFSDLIQKTLLNYNKMSQWEIMIAQQNMRKSLVNKFSFMHDVSDVLVFTNRKDKIIAYGDYGFELNLKENFRDS